MFYGWLFGQWGSFTAICMSAESAQLRRDMIVASSIAGPRPEWVKPWWLNPERAFA